MGVCYSLRSIQQIIHSKYTLAKDEKQKQNSKQQYCHVYIWKYNSNALLQKNVMFYSSNYQETQQEKQQRNQIFKQNKKRNEIQRINKKENSNPKHLFEINNLTQNINNSQKGQQINVEYLIGQPLEWPFKTFSDQGYIILTIENNKKKLQNLLLQSENGFNNHKESQKTSKKLYNTFIHKKVPLQMLEILFMIHLDSFKSYYYTEIQINKNDKFNKINTNNFNQFSANLQIITGDLLSQIQCLKLLNIAYQLEKYLIRGGHNIFRKFYNQYQTKKFLKFASQSNTQKELNKQHKVQNQDMGYKFKNSNQNQESDQYYIQIYSVLQNQLKKVQKMNQVYEQKSEQNKSNNNREQIQNYKQKQKNKIINNYIKKIKKFKILKNTLLQTNYIGNLVYQDIYQLKLNNNKDFVNLLLQKYKKNLNNKQDNKRIVIIEQQRLKKCQFNQFNENEKNRNQQINNNHLKYPNNINNNFNNDSLQISMIQGPNNNNNLKNFNKKQQLDISSPFVCQITQIINPLQFQQQQQQTNINKRNKNIQHQQQQTKKFLDRKKQNNKKFDKIKKSPGNINLQDSLFLNKQLQNELNIYQIDKKLYKIDTNLLKNANNSSNNNKKQINTDCSLFVTTYAGSSQFSALMNQNKCQLVINLSPEECYNYFITDIKYEWFYIKPIHKQKIFQKLGQNKMYEGQGWQILEKQYQKQQQKQKFRTQFNIEPLIWNILNQIQLTLNQVRKEDLQNLINSQKNISFQRKKIEQKKIKKDYLICIFCNHKNYIYSGTIVMAYLIFTNLFRYLFFIIIYMCRYSYDQAYQIVKKSLNDKFIIPKIYEYQLKEIQKRINSISCANNVNINSNSLKTVPYNVYSISLYSKYDRTCIVSRYIGQMSSSNQLQNVDNFNISIFLVVPNSLTSIIMKTLSFLNDQKNSIMTNKQLTQFDRIYQVSKFIKNIGLNLRVFTGKELQQQSKKIYENYIKETFIQQIVKYQYINFSRSIFDLEKYKQKINLIIETLKKQILTVETIQKSFRKPQTFEPIKGTIIKDLDLLKLKAELNKQNRLQPFNIKETVVFKYPILRPIFEPKKSDSYYFMIRRSIIQKQSQKQIDKPNFLNVSPLSFGCSVTFYKGKDWIGLEQDKQRYFQKIVQTYLKDVNEQKIWIQDSQDDTGQKSLFDGDSIMIGI